jgi:PAS domain-containing protein
LDRAFAAWNREPALQAGLRDEAGLRLVVDASDGRVRLASAAAGRIADALAAMDGPGLARQLAAACPMEGPPRLARLRLDPRRIIPPSLFLIARASDDEGGTVYLAIPSGPTALPRLPAPAAPVSEPPPAPVPASAADRPVDAPKVGDRFLWRTDARGILTEVTGALQGLAGQSWSDFGASTEVFDSRRTFRRVPVNLTLYGTAIHADLSGAPAGREGQDFRGFEGFGVVRAVEVAARHAPPPVEEPLMEAEPMAPAASSEEAPVGSEASLSLAEHDAFREIARALGARYAGDDEIEAALTGPDRYAGSVTPFPTSRPDLASPPSEDEAETGGLLDDLPIAALVHRGERIITVNRLFLDLTGFADAAALRSAGMEAVFPGGPPSFRSGMTHETVIATADGGSRPVEVTRGICAWEGAPAAILILRSLAEDDPRRALEAERLAREVQAGRAMGAEAALDALQAGVVTVDREGRVVTLNRAAAALFGASPPELVGLGFATLFDSGSAGPLVGALAGEGDSPGVILAGGRAMMLALAPPRADGHRVAVLHRLPDSMAGATVGEAAPRRPSTPLHLDRELREPIDTILALTHTMLEERYGALGDQRYRASLTEIREAGERLRERANELSDLAAVEAGQIDLHPKPLALNEVVANCVAVLQGEASRSRIVLRTSFSANLAELEADEASVRRAASLVIEQAIRRSVAGGQVIVSTGAGEAAEVALRVRDGGHGPNAADTDTPNEDPRLALPRALVQANGGQLRLSGRREEGTLVEILLPVRRGAHG